MCKLNESKERARIQHSMGHLRVIPKHLFSFITRPSAQLTIDMKMIFYSDANKTYFHLNGCALSLVLKPRFFEVNALYFEVNFIAQIHVPSHFHFTL